MTSDLGPGVDLRWEDDRPFELRASGLQRAELAGVAARARRTLRALGWAVELAGWASDGPGAWSALVASAAPIT